MIVLIPLLHGKKLKHAATTKESIKIRGVFLVVNKGSKKILKVCEYTSKENYPYEFCMDMFYDSLIAMIR